MNPLAFIVAAVATGNKEGNEYENCETLQLKEQENKSAPYKQKSVP
jgi:hypothetical protein